MPEKTNSPIQFVSARKKSQVSSSRNVRTKWTMCRRGGGARLLELKTQPKTSCECFFGRVSEDRNKKVLKKGYCLISALVKIGVNHSMSFVNRTSEAVIRSEAEIAAALRASLTGRSTSVEMSLLFLFSSFSLFSLFQIG